MAQLWGGRFTKETDELVKQFNDSLPFDKRLYEQDIRGSVVHAAMLGKQGIITDEEAEKYTAHMWLQRMGYKGPEMKEQRNILLKHLHGYCAFSNGSKMQNHKDKYSAIRRERREAERATAAEPITETPAPTTEAKPSAVAPEKEVAVNE